MSKQYNFNEEIVFRKDVGINCETEEEAIAFLGYLASEGLEWDSGELLVSNSNFSDHKEKTVYHIYIDRRVLYGSYHASTRKIFKFKDIATPKPTFEYPKRLQHLVPKIKGG